MFPQLKSKADWEREAPANLDLAERRAWAKTKYDDAVGAAEEIVGERLRPGVAMHASFNNGELSFWIDGVSVIDRIFVDEGTGLSITHKYLTLRGDCGGRKVESNESLVIPCRAPNRLLEVLYVSEGGSLQDFLSSGSRRSGSKIEAGFALDGA